jgi:hypothetical protein
VKFIITMNMPSAKNYLIHQLTVEVKVDSCADFCEMMNDEEFILCRLLYRRTLVSGEIAFEDRGDVIINTAHIGKVQEYYELEKEYGHDESYGNFEPSYHNPAGERGPVRKRRVNF